MDGMTDRRRLILGGAALGALAACGNPVGGAGAEVIDARVTATHDYLLRTYPATRQLFEASRGVLIMPLVTEAGIIYFGGGYGQGALQIAGATVDYYSATRATIGLQLGAQQYAHALFFMTDEALQEFRTTDGWAVGADARYAIPDRGGSLGVETTQLTPVVALVFGQSGFIAGATLAGIKYTRIIP
jgi:lipid-binding SYLF domain-containing protein